MIQDPNVIRYVEEIVHPLVKRIDILEKNLITLQERLSKHLESVVDRNEELIYNHSAAIKCEHEWVSSVAYKGAKVCFKCNMYK